MNKKSIAAVIAAGALVFAACSDDDATTDTTMTADTMSEETTATEETAAGEIAVEGAWARTSPMMAEMGAAYFTITSPVDDELVSASVDPSVAGMVEIHETKENEAGEMEMSAITALPLPAGEAVSLEPGGYHIMLMKLAAPLEIGSTVSIELTMKSGATLTVDAEVREEAP
jgi:copper(I)-binding protein